MSMTAATVQLVETVASELVNELFATYTSDKIADFLQRRRLSAARERVLVQVLETFQAFFQIEIKEDQACLLLNELQTLLEKADLGPKALAREAYDPEKVQGSLLKQYPPCRDIETLGLSPIYCNLLLQVVRRVSELAHLLPEWERANWEQAFARLERIEEAQKQQTELMKELQAEPVRRMQTLEQHYRKHVAEQLSDIRMMGIRGVAEVLELSLEAAYVEPKLAQASGSKEPTLQSIAKTLEVHRARKLRLPPERPPESEMSDVEQARVEIEHFLEGTDQAQGQSIGDALAKSKRVILVGDPGSGKTTLLQQLAVHAAREELGKLHSELGDSLVPFFFPVRSLNFPDLPTPAEFLGFCAPMLAGPDADGFVRQILEQGRAIVLVDGLDECQVPAESEMKKPHSPQNLTEWDRVIQWIQELLHAFPENRVVVSSRPAGYTSGLLEGSKFAEFRILPLGRSDRAQFVRNWYGAALRYKGDEASRSAESGSEARVKAEDLLRRIEKTPSIHALATTPLMLSVLCIIHHYRGQSLPERRVELLRECVDVLLFEWRKAHGLQRVLGKLDAGKQRGLLQPLAWEMMVAGKAEFPRQRIEEVFRKHLPEIQESPDRAAEIADMIRDRTGVLIERLPGVFAFAHLILQEYLAAEESARGSLDDLLEHADDPAWAEVIPLAAGAMKGNQEALIRSLCKKKQLALAGRCVAAVEWLDASLRTEIIMALVGFLMDPNDWSTWYMKNSIVAKALVEIGGEQVASACLVRIKVLKIRSYEHEVIDRAADIANNLTVDQLVDWADFAAYLTAYIAEGFAPDRAADLAYNLASLPAATHFVVAAYRSAYVADHAASDVLGQLGEQILAPLQQFFASRDLPVANRLLALSPLVEVLSASKPDLFFQHFESLARKDFPLKQLVLCARLWHRLGPQLSPAQHARLAYLSKQTCREFSQHCLRFAKAVDAELGKKDKKGITCDWEAYQTKFTRTYLATLNEKSPPGWNERFTPDTETVRMLLSAGEPDYDTFREMKEMDYDRLGKVLNGLLDSDDRAIRERAGLVLMKVFFNLKGERP